MATTRLLKVLLPSNCLWTPLSKSEGLSYDGALAELERRKFTAEEGVRRVLYFGTTRVMLTSGTGPFNST